MPTLEKLREQIHAPIKRSPPKLPQREMLVADARGCRRPTEFVEQKLLAALERPLCRLPETSGTQAR